MRLCCWVPRRETGLKGRTDIWPPDFPKQAVRPFPQASCACPDVENGGWLFLGHKTFVGLIPTPPHHPHWTPFYPHPTSALFPPSLPPTLPPHTPHHFHHPHTPTYSVIVVFACIFFPTFFVGGFGRVLFGIPCVVDPLPHPTPTPHPHLPTPTLCVCICPLPSHSLFIILFVTVYCG